ncbi:hypothetical protein FB45DRAFT_1055604 [Roridomyces roridus]|uniref:Uncharacterized protein n=1 Tax=Roridomyces roridus TaxID=1738132 RepID=A0AAD7FRY6_9AGAR|nr:hypothetical protein FB45DRAFT_1055604 [Roridomyces roridus]
MFDNCTNFSIHGGNFYNFPVTGGPPVDNQHAALGAQFYNTAESFSQSQCPPETCEAFAFMEKEIHSPTADIPAAVDASFSTPLLSVVFRLRLPAFAPPSVRPIDNAALKLKLKLDPTAPTFVPKQGLSWAPNKSLSSQRPNDDRTATGITAPFTLQLDPTAPAFVPKQEVVNKPWPSGAWPTCITAPLNLKLDPAAPAFVPKQEMLNKPRPSGAWPTCITAPLNLKLDPTAPAFVPKQGRALNTSLSSQWPGGACPIRITAAPAPAPTPLKADAPAFVPKFKAADVAGKPGLSAGIWAPVSTSTPIMDEKPRLHTVTEPPAGEAVAIVSLPSA